MGTESGHTARRVVLLAGPSGSGKSTIVRAAGLPLLVLDDFYRAGSDPALPRDPQLGIVDWDDPRSWDATAALTAIAQLCTEGAAQVPVYDIAADGPVGTRRVEATGPVLVAEGVFAPELVSALHERGLLLDAIVMWRDPWKNLVRRAARDLAERRKPPATILRRGLALRRSEPGVVGRAMGAGCRPLTAPQTRAVLARYRDQPPR